MAIAAPLAGLYAHRANASGKDFAIGPITIANEILWRILPAKRFDELRAIHSAAVAKPQDLPPVMS
jgi:hypothetical protein